MTSNENEPDLANEEDLEEPEEYAERPPEPVLGLQDDMETGDDQ